MNPSRLFSYEKSDGYRNIGRFAKTRNLQASCRVKKILEKPLHKAFCTRLWKVRHEMLSSHSQHFPPRFSAGNTSFLSVKHNLDLVRHSLHVFVQHEVPRIQPNELRFWQITQVGFRSRRHKERILLTSDNQCPGFVRAESGLPLGIKFDVGLVVL